MLVMDVLHMAWFKRRPGKQTGLIFHRDGTIAPGRSSGTRVAASNRIIRNTTRGPGRSSETRVAAS